MNITVYCGSSLGSNPAYAEAAAALGEWIASSGHRMVYGGGNIGLMDICSDRVLKAGGAVTGVIPEFLMLHEHGHDGDYTLEVVPDMHTRKSRMIELGEVYIAMPGGPGTLEEITEVISLRRLKCHCKPCVFYNIEGYYEVMREVYRKMVTNGFMADEEYNNILFINTIRELETCFKTIAQSK